MNTIKKAKTHKTTKPAEGRGDTQWLLLTQKALEQPGGTLLALLLQRANELGLTRTQLAETLGFSYTYLYRLMSGDAEVKGMAQEYLVNASAFLKLPIMAVKLAAGVIEYNELYQDPKQYELSIGLAVDYIRHDAELAGFVTAELATASYGIQELVVHLYERATRRVLTPPKPDIFATAENLMPLKLQEGLKFLERVQRLRHELEELAVDPAQLEALEDEVKLTETAAQTAQQLLLERTD